MNRFRVDRAKRLLADPQSQVKLVAQQVGFENVNTFIRVFKSFEGISPGVYKETLLKGVGRRSPLRPMYFEIRRLGRFRTDTEKEYTP